eukprot:CAMPEP_0184299164 /NCGR_PEP_ID=MMETSP1049-20130417/9825_1 /TAXON_ID=77928 /ORGANISM="Proteomonas sulcata, Strain CCMP704" /LENGTH=47 /DNA_ID= /DNA_START= /DNA_END= /DNA_ORIENTATION=
MGVAVTSPSDTEPPNPEAVLGLGADRSVLLWRQRDTVVNVLEVPTSN